MQTRSVESNDEIVANARDLPTVTEETTPATTTTQQQQNTRQQSKKEPKFPRGTVVPVRYSMTHPVSPQATNAAIIN